MITVFMRTLLIYLILIISMRLMGKRQIGELQISELVTTFMLSELATVPLSNKQIPVAYALVPIFLLLSLEVITSFLLMKSSFLKKLFIGRPSIIIRHGEIDQAELGRMRITVHELLSELRQKDIGDVGEVEYAILEDNGKLSVFQKAKNSPLTPEMAGLDVTENGIAHPIIADGEISLKNLSLAGQNEQWLWAQLKKQKLKAEEIFLLTLNDNGEVFVVKKRKPEKRKAAK